MNISKIAGSTFKGIYLSNALAPGRQREKAKQIKDDFMRNKLDVKYEENGKDILIDPALDSEDGIDVKFVPYSINRILDDDYSRWCGRIY